MPTGYVKKLAKKHNTSVGKSESVWEDAKKQAAKQGKGENFAYITGIYKKMMGEDIKGIGLKDFLTITEMDDVQDIGYGSTDEEDFDDELDGEESFDDEFPEDELDGELDDEFEGEDDLEGHDGHELADIISDDELGGEEDFDEDEFPEDEFPGGDEMPDENGEFSSEEDFDGEEEFPEERNRFREGYETKGSYLQELMMINEKAKKKPLKKAAKAVYHRDYIKTKKKPYRKYHPDHYQDKD